jgi:hypothetical protein
MELGGVGDENTAAALPGIEMFFERTFGITPP